MDDLVTWLLDQVAQDEQLAQDALDKTTYSNRFIRGRMVKVENRPPAWASRAVVWPPARVLAECDTKRRIIEDVALELNCVPSEPDYAGQVQVRAQAALDVLREYGAMYAKLDRPGYREEWRP